MRDKRRLVALEIFSRGAIGQDHARRLASRGEIDRRDVAAAVETFAAIACETRFAEVGIGTRAGEEFLRGFEERMVGSGPGDMDVFIHWQRDEGAHDCSRDSCKIFTPLLVPMRVAPEATIFCKSASERIPPDALTPSPFGLTMRLINATSSTVAPPGPNPVEDFTKSASASTQISQARSFSLLDSSAVSRMTLQ